MERAVLALFSLLACAEPPDAFSISGTVLVEQPGPGLVVVEARRVGGREVLAMTVLATPETPFDLLVRTASVEALPARPEPDAVLVVAGFDADGDGVLGSADPAIGTCSEWLVLFSRASNRPELVPPGAGLGWSFARRPLPGVPGVLEAGHAITDCLVRDELLRESEPVSLVVRTDTADHDCLGVEAPTFGDERGGALLVGARLRRGRAEITLPSEPPWLGFQVRGGGDTTFGRFRVWTSASGACDAESYETSADSSWWYSPLVTFPRAEDPEMAWTLTGLAGCPANGWYLVDTDAHEVRPAGDVALGPPP